MVFDLAKVSRDRLVFASLYSVSGSMKTRKFSSKLDNLGEICDFITQYAVKAGLNESQVYAVQLAVDEAATNIIEHAYGGKEQGEVLITCQVLEDGLKVVLCDHGRSFDPQRVPDPALNVPIEELRPRGLGIFLMRKMMDEVHYKFTSDKGNILTMTKHR